MEYTNFIEPLLCIFVSLTTGIIIGVLYMFFKTNQDVKLMEIDLQITQEQLKKCQSTLLPYINKYDDDDYEAY